VVLGIREKWEAKVQLQNYRWDRPKGEGLACGRIGKHGAVNPPEHSEGRIGWEMSKGATVSTSFVPELRASNSK